MGASSAPPPAESAQPPLPSQALKCHLSGALVYYYTSFSQSVFLTFSDGSNIPKRHNIILNVSVSALKWRFIILYLLSLKYVCNVIFQEGTISLSCLKSPQIIFPTPGNIFSFCFYNKKKDSLPHFCPQLLTDNDTS